MKKKLLSGLVTGLLIFGMAAMANATPVTLNVDFGSLSWPYIGLGAAPDLATSTTWNCLDFHGGSNLLYSDGTQAHGISVFTTASQGWTDGGNALVGDRIFVAGSWTQFTVTISGLNDGTNFDLYAYGSNPLYASTYTVGAISDYAIGNNNGYPFVHHDNYALLSQTSPINGEIMINVDRYQGSRAAVIGGFQLQSSNPVPIPATVLLFGTGVLGLAGTRLRRKKQ